MTNALTVLITGGADGIGRVTAQRFIDSGHRVHVCDVNQEAVAQLSNDGSGITGSVGDVSSVADVERVFAELEQTYGGLDVLVNNAGIAGPTAPAEAIGTEDWDRAISVSLSGQFYCLRRAIPMLRASEYGSIVNISSNAGLFGFPLRLPYAASKWALIGMTKTLAMELGPEGIRVNAICPGSVAGPRIDGVIERDAGARGVAPEAIRKAYERQSSLRCFVEAKDVAEMVYFLTSPLGAKISGQAIGVDGHTESLSNGLE
ncbi:MAG: SDR family oxidoreductase [Pseudomonadota bacterium]